MAANQAFLLRSQNFYVPMCVKSQLLWLSRYRTIGVIEGETGERGTDRA